MALEEISPVGFPTLSLIPAEFTMVAQPKTYVAKPHSVEQKWYIVDASDLILGRLASDIAMVLMGKHAPCRHRRVCSGHQC
jgi:hypothetical protein